MCDCHLPLWRGTEMIRSGEWSPVTVASATAALDGPDGMERSKSTSLSQQGPWTQGEAPVGPLGDSPAPSRALGTS